MPWISVASTEELRSQHTCEIVGADNNYSLFVDEKLASKGRLIAFIERANFGIMHYLLLSAISFKTGVCVCVRLLFQHM